MGGSRNTAVTFINGPYGEKTTNRPFIVHILHHYGEKMSAPLTALYGFIAEVQKNAVLIVLSLLNVKLGSFVEVKKQTQRFS